MSAGVEGVQNDKKAAYVVSVRIDCKNNNNKKRRTQTKKMWICTLKLHTKCEESGFKVEEYENLVKRMADKKT